MGGALSGSFGMSRVSLLALQVPGVEREAESEAPWLQESRKKVGD